MIHVRRHKRVTVTGRTVTVRAHERDSDGGVREVPEWSQATYVGDLTPVADERGTSPEFRSMFLGEGDEFDIWDDDADDEQAARDSVTYGPPVDKSDIGAWADELAARDAAAAERA